MSFALFVIFPSGSSCFYLTPSSGLVLTAKRFGHAFANDPFRLIQKKYKIRALVLKYDLFTEWVGCKAARVFPVQYSCDLPSH